MEVCPQCSNTLNTSNCRLVQDACGHKKCRLCLVLEENGCIVCVKTENSKEDVEDSAESVSNFDDTSYQIQDDSEIKLELFNGLGKYDDKSSQKAGRVVNSATDVLNDKEKNDKTETKKRKKKRIVVESHITVIPGNPIRYQCTVCNKSFGAKYSVKYHNFCITEKKPFQCATCKKGFVTKSHYEYHLRVHSGSQPYVCNSCGKGFRQKGKLTQHLKCHTGERSFMCQNCGKSFASADGLQSHIRTHTGEKPYVCNTCSKAFSVASNYKKHLLIHSGVKSFMCEECGRSFALKRGLDVHLFIHSRERNHVCVKCNRGFAMKRDLQRHMIVHSSDRPHSCSMCGIKFRRKDNLERHVKNTHLEAPVPEEHRVQAVPSQSISKDVEPANSLNTLETSSVEPNATMNPKDIPQPSNPSPSEESCVEVPPAKDRTDNSLNSIIQPMTISSKSIINSESVESITKSSETQPREYYRAVPVINRPANFTQSAPSGENNISKVNIYENPETAKKERPLFEGKNCVRTITRASSSGKTLPQEVQTVIKPKLECFRILERPETFKPVTPPKISQPSLRMLLNDVKCSDNTGTVLNLTQDVQTSRTESLFQDNLAILENLKYDRCVGKGFIDTTISDMHPSDFLLPNTDVNRTSYTKKIYYSEDVRVGSVSYDHFMGTPYVAADVGGNPDNSSLYFRTDKDVSERLKLLADVAGTKDPSVHISQVIVGTKKHITNVVNTNLNF